MFKKQKFLDMDSVNSLTSSSNASSNKMLNKLSPSSSLTDLISNSSRVSAEEMDEKRQQNIAYEYLCHLEEAKKWIESCIREELPSAAECEENLCNGVYLAKLANFFCPEKVSFKQIYDKDQSKYQAKGLHFKHTDNINHWFIAMEHIGLPKIFFPETTDIYNKKNMPRVIYCLHALGLYLFKLGIAPQIQDLYGVAKFTEEEITSMARELKKYGLQLPTFSKIGGILANEMPVDEAALHAAILAINDAIEKKDLNILKNDLKLYDARINNINDDFIKFYHEIMFEAKINKSKQAKNKSNNDLLEVYDELLTQFEIQNLIDKINGNYFSTIKTFIFLFLFF
jgi:Ras GTPase-activating-like protein IQGAP1